MPARRKQFLSFILTAIFLALFYSPAFAAITFSIQNPATVDDQTEVEVSITGLTSSSCQDGRCYLQGTLTDTDQNQYFGQTSHNDGTWYSYQSTPAIDTLKSTFFYFEPKEGSWSGKLKVKNNPTDTNYHGPGEYLLKLRRYTGKSTSSAGESNPLSVDLSYILPTPTPTAESTPSSTPRSTTTTTPSPSDSDSSSVSISTLPLETPIGKVAGISTTKKNKAASFPADLKLSLDSATNSASAASIILSSLESSNSAKSRSAGQPSWPTYVIYSGGGLTTFAVAWLLVRSYNKGLLWPWLKLPFS